MHFAIGTLMSIRYCLSLLFFAFVRSLIIDAWHVLKTVFRSFFMSSFKIILIGERAYVCVWAKEKEQRSTTNGHSARFQTNALHKAHNTYSFKSRCEYFSYDSIQFESVDEWNKWKKNHLIRAIVWEMKFRLRLSHMMSNNGPKMDDWIPKFCKNNLKTLQFLNTINKRLHSSSSFLNFVWQRMWFNSFNTKRRWQINICYSSLTFVTGTKWKDRTTKNDYDISGCSLSQFLLLITILVPLTDMWCCIVVSIFSQVGRKRRSHDKTEISNKHKCCENKWL